MKLRIKGNSIRLRLTQTELDQFVEIGRVEETLHFPHGRRLRYALQAQPDADQLAARFGDDGITLVMPDAWVQPWGTTDRVGFEATQPLDDGEGLYLLVEKDFQCLHKRPDEEDAFPHPLADDAGAS